MASTVALSRLFAYASLVAFLTCSPVHAVDSSATSSGTQTSTAGQAQDGKGDNKKGEKKGDGKKNEKGASSSKGGSSDAGGGGDSPRTAATTVKCPTQEALDGVSVTAAYNRKKNKDEVQLGDELVVQVDGLKFLMDAAKCQRPQKKVLLYLDGRPITNLSPEPPTDPKNEELIFPLKRKDKSREAWTAILGKPGFYTRKVGVSVGVENEHAISSTTEVDFLVMSGGWFALWIALLIAVASGLKYFEKGEMLRVPGPKPEPERGPDGKPRLDENGKPVRLKEKAFSLSRVQMAWWTFLTLAAWGFIGIITGDFISSVTGSTVVLIGLSAGTIAAATAIDRGDERKAELKDKVLTVPASESLWEDIVSDGEEVSLHRYQMAVWTIALGIIFVITVYIELAMPTFSDTLLALMGISAGTYVGVKTVEAKPKSKPDPDKPGSDKNDNKKDDSES